MKAKHSKIETSYNITNQDLVNSLEETISTLSLNFNKPINISKQIVSKYILNIFKQMQLDCDNLGYIDFFKKYIKDYKMLSVEDATQSQMYTIINESPLTFEDKKIAEKLFINFKTHEEIAEEMNIAEVRTIGIKKEKIRDTLKQTAYKLFCKD